MPFSADYFDGVSSKVQPVRVSLTGDCLRVESGEGGPAPFAVPLRACRIEPALGSTRRVIELDRGRRLVTGDQGAVTELERLQGANTGLRLVHFLETRWRAVAAAAAVTALAMWAAVTFGLPWLAERAAFALPEEVTLLLGRETLDAADSFLLRPSKLEETEKKRLTALYDDFLRETGWEGRAELVFRKSKVGVNAFALPSGVVVMTDEMAAFVQSDDEFLSVAAHELAHLERRHALRSVIQNAGVFAVLTLLTGDMTALGSAASALPVFLVESRYSRRFEEEADEMGARRLRAAGRPLTAAVTFMERLAERHPRQSETTFLSTHPGFTERIEKLRKLSEER